MFKADIKQKIFLLSSRPLLKQAPSQACPGEVFLLVADRQAGEHARPATAGRVCVDQPWLARLYPPAVEGEDRRYETCGVKPAPCRHILMSPGLSGARVRRAPGSQLE
jgi:hypothetical protein